VKNTNAEPRVTKNQTAVCDYSFLTVMFMFIHCGYCW